MICLKITHFLRSEFVGLEAKVVKSSQPAYVGIRGRVIDETLNTLVVKHENEDKVIVKKVATFHFFMPDGTVLEVDGKAIISRPQDRVKTRIMRRW